MLHYIFLFFGLLGILDEKISTASSTPLSRFFESHCHGKYGIRVMSGNNVGEDLFYFMIFVFVKSIALHVHF